jgi:hypothetical protein
MLDSLPLLNNMNTNTGSVGFHMTLTREGADPDTLKALSGPVFAKEFEEPMPPPLEIPANIPEVIRWAGVALTRGAVIRHLGLADGMDYLRTMPQVKYATPPSPENTWADLVPGTDALVSLDARNHGNVAGNPLAFVALGTGLVCLAGAMETFVADNSNFPDRPPVIVTGENVIDAQGAAWLGQAVNKVTVSAASIDARSKASIREYDVAVKMEHPEGEDEYSQAEVNMHPIIMKNAKYTPTLYSPVALFVSTPSYGVHEGDWIKRTKIRNNPIDVTGGLTALLGAFGRPTEPSGERSY